MRLSVYVLGYRVLVVDVADTSNATYVKQPERWVDRGVKGMSKWWTARMVR